MRKLEIIEIHLTHHCNLNCRGCTHYAPLAEPWFKDLSQYVRELARLKELTKGNLNEIRLMGGEPLLHPQVSDFLYITRQAFPAAEIQLVTNGLLIGEQNQKFFDTLNGTKTRLYLSDYNLSPKIKEIIQEKIDLYIFGTRSTFIKPALNLHGSNRSQQFQHCMEIFQEPCIQLKDGYLYHCPSSAYIDFFLDYFNINLKEKSEGYNIFNPTASVNSIEEWLNTPAEFCKYCDIEARMQSCRFALSERKASEWLD